MDDKKWTDKTVQDRTREAEDRAGKTMDEARRVSDRLREQLRDLSIPNGRGAPKKESE
jgi:plasmid replication initiation protein